MTIDAKERRLLQWLADRPPSNRGLHGDDPRCAILERLADRGLGTMRYGGYLGWTFDPSDELATEMRGGVSK